MTKILVVDDNATNRKIVLTLLRHEGYATVEAADGADGLRVAIQERPQLIISDILMPSMDGYEFVRQLRSHPDLAPTTVVFYTANYHTLEARNLAEQCGVSRVIVKPCGARDFLRAVAEVLEGVQKPAAPKIEPEFDRQHLQVLTDVLSKKADQLTALNNRFAALTELNIQLASERNPWVLLDRVCSGARDLLGAKYGVLALAEKVDSEALRVWTSGLGAGVSTIRELTLESGLPAQAYKLARSIRTRSQSGPLDLGFPAHFPAVTSALIVPIASLTRTYGWLCLADKLGSDEFDADDERMLGTLGAQVGRIYENGTLYLEVRQQTTRLLEEMTERERATEELRASELRFRQMAENIEDVFFISSPDLSQIIYVSPAYERISGHTCAELYANPNSCLDLMHPGDRTRVARERALASRRWPEHTEIEFRLVRPDGQVRWINERLFPISDGHSVQRAVGVCTDITERKLAEDRIVQLSRVHAMLSGINSLIVRVLDRNELFKEACRLAVEEGRFEVAWCAMIDQASGQLRVVASCGELPQVPQLLTPVVKDDCDANPVLAAINSQTVQICNNLQAQSDPLLGREILSASGYGGMAVFPLTINGISVGCLALITDEIGLFDPAEKALLVELAGDISFALDHLEKADRLNYLAYYDALTGLANSMFFNERLSLQVGGSVRGGDRFALVVVGPQRQEGFNDALEHGMADDLIRKIAARFVDCVGTPDLVARIGTDQFAAIIPEIQSDYALEGTLKRWWDGWPGPAYDINGTEITVSAKAGIALFPTDGADAATLMRNAQTALKKAKNSSSKHIFYTSSLSERIAERLTLENQIRRALENEEFVLHYQPKVDLLNRRIMGVEALMRWQHPQLGLVPPSKFIPIMEETGLIVEAGTWALRQACVDRSVWLERYNRAPRVAVNVSAVQLRHDDFVRTVTTILDMAGPEAGIDIEVTETLLMENMEENIQKLSALRSHGAQIALDDFGTGYSSLSYLAKLPVETLKIDRAFVIAMLDDPSATAVVSTIISLARALKLETVAEGVESEEQAKILRLLQCDQMQGFLISQPLSCEDMTNFLGRSRRTESTAQAR